jgi:hypothetical protein
MSINVDIENESIEMHPLKDGTPEEELKLSCGDFCKGISNAAAAKSGADWAGTAFRLVGLCASIYAFLFSLDLMGTAFKVSTTAISTATAFVSLQLLLHPSSQLSLTPQSPHRCSALVRPAVCSIRSPTPSPAS